MALSNRRISAATSSTIVSIVSNGRSKDSIGSPFFTYLEECRYELSLLQNLEGSSEVLATDWGKLVEGFVHDLLPKAYSFHSDKTEAHPKYPRWVGTPDGSKQTKIDGIWVCNTITDIKCPLTKKAFCQLTACLYDIQPEGGVKPRENYDSLKAIERVRDLAKDGDKFYWQLISNACIFNTDSAELIVFMPYKETLDKIVKYNEGLPDGSGYYSVSSASTKDGRLPYILKESGYNEINIIRFDVPIEDKKLLERRYQILDFGINLTADGYDSFLDHCQKVKNDETAIRQYIFNKTGEEIN